MVCKGEVAAVPDATESPGVARSGGRWVFTRRLGRVAAAGALVATGAVAAIWGAGGTGRPRASRSLPRVEVRLLGARSKLHWSSLSAVAVKVVQSRSTRAAHVQVQTAAAPATPRAALADWAATVVTPTEMAEWSKVAMCESHGDWARQGPTHSGGLGFANSTWDTPKYDGTQFAPDAGLATPAEQVVVAMRIQSSVPDQQGCGSGW